MTVQHPFTMLSPLRRAGAQVAEAMADPSKTKVARRLAEVGIDDPKVARRSAFELPGVLRQRVGLAASLAGDPDILIADEPSTALDATTQAGIVALLQETGCRREMGLILIAHDLRLAFSICDRILVLHAGSLIEVAGLFAIKAAPRRPCTHGHLMSEPPADRELYSLRAIPGGVPEPDDVEGIRCFTDRCDWARDVCREGQPPLA